MPRTVKRKSSLRTNTYHIVCRAVEEGVAMGISRAHKHTERPSTDALQEHIEREVMTALCEVIQFDFEGE